jgi:hypothetical protein
MLIILRETDYDAHVCVGEPQHLRIDLGVALIDPRFIADPEWTVGVLIERLRDQHGLDGEMRPREMRIEPRRSAGPGRPTIRVQVDWDGDR